MAHYKVQTDKGLVEFDADRADLSQSEVEQVINQNSGGQSQESSSPPFLQGLIGKKAYGIASRPMNTATKLLNLTAEKLTPDQEITNRPALDAVRNAPAIIARSASKVFPGFVSPESMATVGLAKGLGLAGEALGPAAKASLKWGGSQLEEMRGMMPDSLRTAFNDSSAIFAKGKKAASPFYEAGKNAPTTRGVAVGLDKLSELRDVAKNATDHRTLVDAASQLEKYGALDPDIALAARKSIWQIKKSIPKDRFFEMLRKFDTVVKENASMASGDELYKRGLMAESLRSLVPRSENGKMALGKTIAGALSGIGSAISPLALGSAATTAGVLSRKILGPLMGSPVLPAMTATALLQAKRKMDEE